MMYTPNGGGMQDISLDNGSLDARQWESEIGLSKKLSISEQKKAESMSPLPSWVAFLIWLGGWIHSTKISDGRLIAVAILPTRDLAPHFAALGALLDSVSLPSKGLSWNQFLKAPDNMSVFLEMRSGSRSRPVSCEGRVVAKETVNGAACRRVIIEKGPKDFIGLTQFVFEVNFRDYSVSQTRHLTQRRKTRATQSLSFLQGLLPEGELDWADSGTTETHVITSLTSWERGCDEVYIGAEQNPEIISLNNVLLYGDPSTESWARTIVSTPRAVRYPTGVPLTILDGIGPAQCWDNLDLTNLLFFFSSFDWGEEASNIVMPFFQLSDRELASSLKVPEIIVPNGIEVGLALIPFE